MIHNICSFIPFGIKYLINNKPYSFKLSSEGYEICWQEEQLIWSKKYCLLHHLHFPDQIIDATMCIIDKAEYLAVLYHSGLLLFTLEGDSIEIPLQFQISKIFPLHKSLLLFRPSQSELIRKQYKRFPVLFTLFHPLEDIRPVAYSNMLFSPSPKHMAITSPNYKYDYDLRINDENEKKIFYITDSDFLPLQVSNERAYLLASSGSTISIWKFKEPNECRDLLFPSPHFVRSPSIFSPTNSKNIMSSPGITAKNDLNFVFESTPPDLYMEMIYEFNDGNNSADFVDISNGERKIILFLQNNKLRGLDNTDIDSIQTLFTFENVESICKFRELMFFVVYTNGMLILHEENRVIFHFPFKNVKCIQKFGRQYVCSYKDGTYSSFYFELSFKPVIFSVLNSAHLALSPENYATLVLSLKDVLSDYENFIPSFVDLFISLIDESEILKFINSTHLLFEEFRVRNDKEKETKLLARILIKIANFANLPHYVLYYFLHTNSLDEQIDDSAINFPSSNVPNITGWICDSFQGKTIEEFPKLYHFSGKISNIFSRSKKIHDIKDIVNKTIRTKFSLKELELINTGIRAILKQAFQITAKNPPQNWPVSGYSLIGRNDISKLYEYIKDQKCVKKYEFKQKDLRFLEVERLLQSHIPLTVDVERPNGISDIEFQSMLINRLQTLIAKQWSLSIGRGLFNLKTFEPDLSQAIIKLELNRIGYSENDNELTLDEKAFTQEQIRWTEFHNGVADGLSVFSADGNWIIDTLKKEVTPYSSGELFGFGLNGLFKKLCQNDLYQFLSSTKIPEQLNIISFILCLSIKYRKTHDDTIANFLKSKISFFPQFTENQINNSLLIQVSAICGIGFLYESTSNRNLTELLINSLEKNTLTEEPVLAFSLGVSIGLINLGLGDKSRVLRDNRERLYKMFDDNKNLDEYVSEKMNTFGNSNFVVISPPAIIALTLGYLNTGDQRVKTILSLPNSASDINKMLPDIILLRTTGALLIDDNPDSTLDFIVPKGLSNDSLVSFVTGISIACGIKYAGTLNKKAFEKVQTIAKCLCLLEKSPFDFTNCNLLHREQYLAIVVLSCSLIIAGTCDVDFLRFVRYIRRRSISTNLSKFTYGFHMILSMAIGVLNLGKGRFTIGTSNSQMAALFIALYPRISVDINDNSFYFQPLRHLIALTAIPRVLEVRDIETQEIVNLNANIKLNNGMDLLINTPHVLPPYKTIKSISIKVPKYYEINLDPFPYVNENISPIIWIKKLPEKEKQEELNLENLRILFKMNEMLKLDKVNGSEEYLIQKFKFESECDKIGNKIVDFFRSSSIKERIELMKKYPNIKNFLLFYGISPSALNEEIASFDDDAIAFLIPFLSNEEILLIEKGEKNKKYI